MELRFTHGVLALVGGDVDARATAALQRLQLLKPESAQTFSAKPHYHITLVSKSELRALQMDVSRPLAPVDSRHVHLVGIGSGHGAFFLVVVWAAGQQFRKSIGLPPKQFHITLSDAEAHDIDKGIDSLLPGELPQTPSGLFLDHLSYTCYLTGDYRRASAYAEQLCVSDSKSGRGFIRLADAALSMGQAKLAMLSYAGAYERSSDPRLRGYCLKRITACSEYTEWGCVFTEPELAQLPNALARLLTISWSVGLREAASDLDQIPGLILDSRERLYIPSNASNRHSFYELPRWFRWIVPFHIALMSTPRNEEDVDMLSSGLGIRHIITLTEESPLSTQWFSGKIISTTYLPIPNFCPPTIEQMDFIMRLLQDDSKYPVLIHCGGGKGRAGTVAACYIATYGFRKASADQIHPEMSPNEAIEALRRIRPDSLETVQQESFVSKWCSTIWKRQGVVPALPPEPPSYPLETEGTLGSHNDLFVLVGLPGSGKSSFCRALRVRNLKGWTYISQDDTGSRGACETALGNAKGRVLLDRCNSSAEDRKAWLELASHWAQAPDCVWFDYDRDLCTSRAQNRAGHPNLPPGGRVRNAMEQMSRTFVRPTLEEGFTAITRIRSFAAAEELVRRPSPPVVLFKYPRTAHLINLGAATEDDLIQATDVPSHQGVHVIVTEKVDGANMGFSLSSDRPRLMVQNRSHYVNASSHEQFRKLDLWIEQHREGLYRVLDRDPMFAERYILFGEWLAATHSIPYTRLPNQFMAFDLYDRSTASWATKATLRNILAGTNIQMTPTFYEGPMPSRSELARMVHAPSHFYDGPVEGVYVVVERGGRVVDRGKVVRGDFIAGNEHWSRGNLRLNSLVDGSLP